MFHIKCVFRLKIKNPQNFQQSLILTCSDFNIPDSKSLSPSESSQHLFDTLLSPTSTSFRRNPARREPLFLFLVTPGFTQILRR